MKNIFKIILAVSALFLNSCDNFFNPEIGNVLLEEDHYEETNNVKTAFLGLAASFQDVPENTIIVMGLRGDLMEPTENAPNEFWDVHRYKAGNGNSIIAPDVYYKTIINCNDFIRHAIEFNRKNPGLIAESTMRGMIADALRYRAWCYFTIGKIYGEAIYYDFAIVDYNDISNARILKFDELLDELLANLNTGIDGFDGLTTFDWNDLTNSEDVSWNRMGINKNALLGEMYMWKGQYREALTALLDIINNSGATTLFTLAQFPLNSSSAISYTDWRYFFTLGSSTALNELITYVPFNIDYQQQNKLQYYFSASGTNVYYMRPTTALVNLSTTKDNNYNRRRYTYTTSGGKYYIQKYSIDALSYERDAIIPIYRAADIHLMIAECLNRLGLFEDAMAFINKGPAAYWNAGGYFLYPFSNPIYTNNLKESLGVRGRLNLAAKTTPTGTDEEKMLAIDEFIAEEIALECAYEGKRFFTLMRMAKYWNKPEFLAEKIAAKYPEGEQAEFLELLKNPENWFIKYDQLKKD